MKIFAFLVILSALIISCGGYKKAGRGIIADNSVLLPDSSGGFQLIAKNDCFTCHKMSKPATGPSWDAIAVRYDLAEKNIRMLADKILKGGGGNWGNVPMLPHTRLSEVDAQKIVVYILSQKNNQ